MNGFNLRTLTCKNGKEKVTVFVATARNYNGYWWAIKGSHMAHKCTGAPLKSGKQLNNMQDATVFTYYGDGNPEHPESISDVYTFMMLLTDK